MPRGQFPLNLEEPVHVGDGGRHEDAPCHGRETPRYRGGRPLTVEPDLFGCGAVATGRSGWSLVMKARRGELTGGQPAFKFPNTICRPPPHPQVEVLLRLQITKARTERYSTNIDPSTGLPAAFAARRTISPVSRGRQRVAAA